jgi:hypothetical protein
MRDQVSHPSLKFKHVISLKACTSTNQNKVISLQGIKGKTIIADKIY